MASKYISVFLIVACLYLCYTNNYYKDAARLVLPEGVDIDDVIRRIFQEFFYRADSNSNNSNNNNNRDENDDRLFTRELLKQFSNADSGLYLSILGRVYDVTKGNQHYGPGAQYNSFVGRDASLAFITGDFTEKGLTDDISSLSNQQTKQLYDWIKFYDNTYIYKGKLVGRFYDNNGNPTKDFAKLKEKVALADGEKSAEESEKTAFPPCNIEWKPEEGTRVWCSTKSGGIERNWAGVPRMYFEKPGSKQHRCACVKLESKQYKEKRANFREFQGCPLGATQCYIKLEH